jgi:hypothetical protein
MKDYKFVDNHFSEDEIDSSGGSVSKSSPNSPLRVPISTQDDVERITEQVRISSDRISDNEPGLISDSNCDRISDNEQGIISDSDSDSDSFNPQLSISKSKPPLPPATTQQLIGFKELPPRQGKSVVKSEIEKRLESLSAERSLRIARILRDS